MSSKVRRFLFSVISFIVSVWRSYEKGLRWAAVVALIIFLLTGELFTINGLIALLIIIPPPIIIYYLEKWLDKYEE